MAYGRPAQCLLVPSADPQAGNGPRSDLFPHTEPGSKYYSVLRKRIFRFGGDLSETAIILEAFLGML